MLLASRWRLRLFGFSRTLLRQHDEPIMQLRLIGAVALALGVAGCAHDPTVAERRLQRYNEEMEEYCAGPDSRDENGKPDEDCRRFYAEQVAGERRHRHRVMKAIGAGFASMGRAGQTTVTNCTSSPYGTRCTTN